MSPTSTVSALTSGLACALLLALTGAQLSGQADPPVITTTQFGIGYVANAPDLLLGGSAYVILPKWGGIGLYVDAKFDSSAPSDERGYDATVTAADVEGEVEGSAFNRAESTWWSANAAVVRPFTRYFAAYIGGGVVTRTVFKLYTVPLDAPVGFGGVVWAEDPRDEETGFNFMIGGITRMTSHVSAQFGYETQPGGVTAGLSLRIPRW